jgi:hypothetical protein
MPVGRMQKSDRRGGVSNRNFKMITGGENETKEK